MYGDPPEDRFFRSICMNAGVAMIATDEHLRVRFWNPAAGRMLGGSPEGMIGQPLTSIIPSDRRELAQRLCQRTLEEGVISEFDFRHRDPAGQQNYLAVTLSPIVESDGRRTGVSVCVRDVTRRMDLERRMAEARKMASLGAMAGAVAHHFNNLVGGIMTSLDFAQSSNDPRIVRRSLETASTALTRAGELTLRLLAFAQGDRKDTTTGQITSIIHEFVHNSAPGLSSRHITVEAAVQPIDAPVPVNQLRTILECLTANACEAMPDGGVLRIALSQTQGHIELRVEDTGKGIAEEHLSRVFEPFYTTKRTGATDDPGHVGLGLAVVHGIVTDLGGTVTLSSAPGQGTVCTIRLPVHLDRR